MNKLAQAMRQVRDALAVPVRPLRGLRSVSNSACLIELGSQQAVLRLHTLDFGAPVNDHAREIAIHQFAAAAGLSPAIIYASVEHGILVSEYVSAGSFSKRSVVTRKALAAVGECLQRLHALTPPASLDGYTLAAAADTYLRRAGMTDDARYRSMADAIGEREAQANPADRALCHRDLLYSNILDCRPVMLIDWEFASPGERWFDLAAMIAWHALGPRQQDALVSAYLGRAPYDTERRAITRNVASFEALCVLWSLDPV